MSNQNLTMVQILNNQRMYCGVANEAFNFNNATTGFKRVFSTGLFDKLRHRLTELCTPRQKLNGGIGLNAKVSPKLRKHLDQTTYVELRPVEVYVPVGLATNVGTYTAALADVHVHMKALSTDLIQPTTNYFNILLNNASIMTANSTLDMSMLNAPLRNVDRSKYIKAIGNCFSGKQVTDRMTYGDAYRSNKDFCDVVDDILTLVDNVERTRPDMIEKAVNQLFHVAELLVSEMQSNEEYAHISPKIANELSELIYKVAEWVEWYGTWTAQVAVLSVAVRDSFNVLEVATGLKK